MMNHWSEKKKHEDGLPRCAGPETPLYVMESDFAVRRVHQQVSLPRKRTTRPDIAPLVFEMLRQGRSLTSESPESLDPSQSPVGQAASRRLRVESH